MGTSEWYYFPAQTEQKLKRRIPRRLILRDVRADLAVQVPGWPLRLFDGVLRSISDRFPTVFRPFSDHFRPFSDRFCDGGDEQHWQPRGTGAVVTSVQ
jgi:hypothetical protein